MILEHGFPIETPVLASKITALMHCSGIGNAECLQIILNANQGKAKKYINQRDSIGRTALHFACRAGNLQTYKVLIE